MKPILSLNRKCRRNLKGGRRRERGKETNTRIGTKR